MDEKYYIVRANKAGVFFGKIKERKPYEVTMTNVRKLWYWDGACAVEQLACDGINESSINKCKFTVFVDEMIIGDPIQIIPCTEKASAIILGVKSWKR